MSSGLKTRSILLLLPMTLVGLVALAIGIWLMLPSNALSASATSPPTIDGELGQGEWASAAKEQYSIGQAYYGMLYVMNDDNYLYIAIQISDATDDGYKDYFQIMFDDTNSGRHSEGDDGVLLQPPDNMIDCFWSIAKWPDYTWNYNSDPSDGGTTDCSGAAKYSNGTWTFEIRKDLRSADTAHDFQLSKGQTIGFAFVWTENNNPVGGFPESSVLGSGHDDPSKFGKMKIWTENYMGIALILGGCLALVAVGVAIFTGRRAAPPPPPPA